MSESPSSPAADALAVARLAALPPMEYDRVREAEAKALGIRVTVLDQMVRQTRPPDERPPEYSDEALAQRFTAKYGERLRYVALWGKWLIWDGVAWRRDETMHSFDLARAICREASVECTKPSVATSIASAQTVAAVERLAKADRVHAATTDQWDADVWLLNTPRGVVDLRSGDLIKHAAERHMTKCAAVTPFGECPLWMAFLHEITNKDKTLQEYLQRVAGYALTGLIREHALFFGYGTGGNGKGTFLNTISGIMADYAITAAAETFAASTHQRHLQELARLQGARLVVAQETEEGRGWAEARIKALTGGDKITANFMRQNDFEFFPQFKLFVAGNHKPTLRAVDRAIRRRLHMIPFVVEVAQVDKVLFERLQAEWPGILQWMIEGCLAWQAAELSPPDVVSNATEDYFDDEDIFGQWIAECCTLTGYGAGDGAALFKSWTGWARAAGEEPGSRKKFSAVCTSRGYTSRRGTGGKVMISGISLAVPHARTETEAERD